MSEEDISVQHTVVSSESGPVGMSDVVGAGAVQGATSETLKVEDFSPSTGNHDIHVETFHGQEGGNVLENSATDLDASHQVVTIEQSGVGTAIAEPAVATGETLEAGSVQNPLGPKEGSDFQMQTSPMQQVTQEFLLQPHSQNIETEALNIQNISGTQGAMTPVNNPVDPMQHTAPLQPTDQAIIIDNSNPSHMSLDHSKLNSVLEAEAAPAVQKDKKKRNSTDKSKTTPSTKRKRSGKGKNENKKGKNGSDVESDSDSLSDTDETNREFSRPSRRSLKNSPEFAKAYALYSKAHQEKKAAEAQFDKVSKQFEAALQRKALADTNLARAKEALYEADLQVSCYWNTMYHKLAKYKEINGHCMVPYTRGVVTDAEEKKLGAWVHCQRKNYHNYQKAINMAKLQGPQSPTPPGPQGNIRMKPQRIVALEKLGFVWSFFDTKWSQRITDLAAYKERHGHLNVPFKYPPNQSLAHWVHNQRRDYNLFQEGKPSQMTVEKINELESLGFAWKSDYPRTKRKLTPEPVSLTEAELWGENYNALVAFHQQYGHCSVNRFTSPNRKLCAWLTWQRKQHKLYMSGQSSQLNPERIKKLNDLKFEWTPRNKPGSGGVLIPKPNVIAPIGNIATNIDSINKTVSEATTMTIPMEIGGKSDAEKMEVAVAPTPAYQQNELKMEYPQDVKVNTTDGQAPNPLNQHQHLPILHPVESEEVELMAQI